MIYKDLEKSHIVTVIQRFFKGTIEMILDGLIEKFYTKKIQMILDDLTKTLLDDLTKMILDALKELKGFRDFWKIIITTLTI